MQPHQQSVVNEKTALDEKAKKLSEFIGNSPIFFTLDAAEQERLKEQCEIMWQYSEILGARIAAQNLDAVGVAVEPEVMLEKRSIDEFREAGLLLLTNQFLHIFGWALTVEIDDDGNVTKFYPAHCKFRGFDNDSTSKAYEQITKHLEKRMPELLKDLDA